MSLRTRIAVIVATTVTVVLALTGVALQAVTGSVLIGAVDEDLRAIATSAQRDPRGMPGIVATLRGRLGGAQGVVQVVDERGGVVRLRGPLAVQGDSVRLPIDERTLDVARGARGATSLTVELEGVPLRMLVVPLEAGLALQVARPIDEVEAVVAGLRRATLAVGLLGVALAALLALEVARRSIRPVVDLTAAVEGVRDGADLARRLPDGLSTSGDDEIARLARAFDAMLERLDASRLAQEQLAADAAHELRTPLTSLRTNLEVLAVDAERLAPEDRRRLSEDVAGQLDELTAMVDGLVMLARIDAGGSQHATIDVAALVSDVVASARRRHPQRASDLRTDIEAGSGPVRVRGDERELTLAVSALLDNAVKYAPDGPIVTEVGRDPSGPRTVAITVRDTGPGVDGSLIPRLFERFFRAPEARSAPGAGLGLALVERVARAHGGRAVAAPGESQGLAVTILIPEDAAVPQPRGGSV